jgi:hypothetical protein
MDRWSVGPHAGGLIVPALAVVLLLTLIGLLALFWVVLSLMGALQ